MTTRCRTLPEMARLDDQEQSVGAVMQLDQSVERHFCP